MDPKLEGNPSFQDTPFEMDPKLENVTALPGVPPLDAGFQTEQPKLSKAETELLLDDHGRQIQPWHEQITIRALVVGAAISTLFCIMVLK